MQMLPSQTPGKLSTRDATTARLLGLAPWVAVLATSIPAPLIFLLLFLTATATDTAAFYILLAGLSLTLGLAFGVLLAAILLFYRRKWLLKLRDRLASDGITASEVVWFRSELTSAERAALKEIEQSNPLLADAYRETLASRLTAARIISRSKRELLKVERRLNRARTLGTRESKKLQSDLNEDHARLKHLLNEANEHLDHAKTRLQVIEATASRKFSQGDTDLMMQRLGQARDQLPLVLEIAQLEQQMLRETNPPLTENGVTQNS